MFFLIVSLLLQQVTLPTVPTVPTPEQCYQISKEYHAVVNPWIGYENGGWDIPSDALIYYSENFGDIMAGGYRIYISPTVPDKEYLWVMITREITPPNPDGGYPLYWGQHNGCALIRNVHPLQYAFRKASDMFWDTYRAVALPYLIN